MVLNWIQVLLIFFWFVQILKIKICHWYFLTPSNHCKTILDKLKVKNGTRDQMNNYGSSNSCISKCSNLNIKKPIIFHSAWVIGEEKHIQTCKPAYGKFRTSKSAKKVLKTVNLFWPFNSTIMRFSRTLHTCCSTNLHPTARTHHEVTWSLKIGRGIYQHFWARNKHFGKIHQNSLYVFRI